jgi:protein SCO1/2
MTGASKMSKTLHKLLFVLFISGAAHADYSGLPYYQDKSLTPYWIGQVDEPQHRMGDFKLTNQAGEQLGSAHLKGKVRIVNFFFATCPGICPTTMRQLERVEQEIDADRAVLLSFSITPNIDTPDKLAEYASGFQIDSEKWQLLTGDEKQITSMARDSFFAVLDRNVKENSVVHTEKAFLVDGEGFIRGVYNATSPADVMRLIEDYELLLTLPAPPHQRVNNDIDDEHCCTQHHLHLEV